MPRQEFVQSALLMSAFEQRLSFLMLQNAGGGLEVLWAVEGFHGKARVGVQVVMPVKNFGLFTSGGQIS